MKNLIFTIAILVSVISYSQVNVIFTINKPFNVEVVSDSLNFSYVELERMEDAFSIVMDSLEQFVPIRLELNKGANLSVIGGWDANGNTLVFPNPQDNHSRSKYKSKMKKKKIRDENGDVISEVDYTDEELENGVIGEIFGWDKREY